MERRKTAHRVPGSPESKRATERLARTAEDTLSQIASEFASAKLALDRFASSAEIARATDALAGAVASAFEAGGKVLICGNGGSLCDAAHFAEELTGRFRGDRRPLPAIALTDAGHLSCTANDYGYEHVFARGVQAIGKPGDVFIGLSTSGNSPNVVKAVEAAESLGLTVATLLGKDGGLLKGRGTIEVLVPGATADRIQELHMIVLHTVVASVELRLGLIDLS